MVSSPRSPWLVACNHVVTHSLQEPLRKLSLFADILSRTTEKGSTQKSVSRLLQMVSQMQKVTTGLQQYIWLSDTSYQTTDLNEAAFQATEKLQQKYPGVKISDEKDELPFINADSKQMQLLFYELLSNAVKFRKAENNARITIRSAILMLNKFRHIPGKYGYTEFVRIEIKDDGMGFKNEYREQVFQLFRKLHKKEGQGIWLALCKKIAENHHGSITISSDENEGTTVELFLPVNAGGVWV